MRPSADSTGTSRPGAFQGAAPAAPAPPTVPADRAALAAPAAHARLAARSGPDGTPPALALRRLLEARRGERHVVAIQDFPDPDAISSALAYQEIARGFGVRAEVMYEGLISHPENVALVELLELDLVSYRRGTALGGFDAAVFVDNQGATTRLAGRLKDAGVPTLAVIDHHDPDGLLEPVFCDVRPVAAAATILAEYLASGALLAMDRAAPRHVRLATALMHGLHSETDGFVRAREPEYAAAAFLSGFSDPDLLERVLCVRKPRATLQVVEAALRRRVVMGGFSVAGVGCVRWEDRDAIPQAAEFLQAEEGVDTVVVFGLLYGGEAPDVVSGSLRSHDARLRVSAFLLDALGTDAEGRPFGGGRSRAGGFEVDTRFPHGGEPGVPEPRDHAWKRLEPLLRERLFRAAGVAEPAGSAGPEAADG